MYSPKKYILFPKPNLKHLLFLFFLIIACLKKGVQIYFEQNQKLAIEFLKLYMYNVGDFFSIIPFMIMKKRMRNRRPVFEIKNTIASFYLQYKKFDPDSKKFKRKTLRNLFIFSVVDFIAYLQLFIM